MHTNYILSHCTILQYLLLNLRSPRDYVGPPFVRSGLWYFLSPLDGASVREAHCEQASTAVREAHCEQASTAVRRTEAPCAQASTARRLLVIIIFDTVLWQKRAWKTSHYARAQAATVSDWLNPLSLGTMSASGYIENLA